MFALTVRQPWAWGIAEGVKPIEFRSWKPGRSLLVGDSFAIHAGAYHFSEDDLDEAAETFGRRPPDELDTSAIIAIVRLAAVDGDDGDYRWHVDQIRRLAKPVETKGKLGLWPVLPIIRAAVLKQI
jgi:hypothetical protein